MLDDSGIDYTFKDRGSDLDSGDSPGVAASGSPQIPLNSIENGSFPLPGATQLDDNAAPATEADTAITVVSDTSVTADIQSVGAPESLLSADEANEVFGSGTNTDFLMLAAEAASQNPLNFYDDGNNPVFGITSPGAETLQKEKDSDALPAERPRNLIDAGTTETNTPTPSIISTADVVAQASGAASPVTVATGATQVIEGVSAQTVTFANSTGTLILNDALGFTGQVSGLAGSDAIDLADLSYGSSTQVTFLGNTGGGTLTITNGTQTANIELVGNYLSSTWDLSSDGNGGTVVVDPVSPNNWQTIDVGAGGFVDGIDIAPNGTMVVRTDTNGAYIWNGTQWQELVTSTSMPSGFVTPGIGQGVYEIQIAPSSTNILYMMFDGYVFLSTNDGTTWAQTSFAQVTESPNDNYRGNGEKMAVDPNNPNIVYVGTPQNGLFVTTNGGTTWQSVSAVPVSLTDSSGDYPGITGIEFDPALGVTGGITNTIFAASYGNGVYESTNGGASWKAIGGPSEVNNAAVSSTGVYYAVGNGDSLWSYANGVWTELYLDTSGNGVQSVAVDPLNPSNIVIVTPGGNINQSFNGGTTWTGINWSNDLTATDVPWLADTGAFMTIGDTVFSPSVPNELIATTGVGVWDVSLPTSMQQAQQWAPIVWTSQSAGIEQLVATDIIVPPGGDPIVAAWDRGFFYISNTDAYPSTYGPVNGAFAAGWSLSYAVSDPSFIVGIADWFGGIEESGYSTDGGQTWTPFASDTPVANGAIGGDIAASTPQNIIWAPSDGSQPYYTLNGGASWSPIVLPGVTSWANFDYAYYLNQENVTADSVLPNTFYLYYQGVYETTNGGQTWTNVYAGELEPGSIFNSQIMAVPGEASNLFFTSGIQGGVQPSPNLPFMRSTNGGATWTDVPNVLEVACFGFGAAAPGQNYPAIYIVGWVNSVYGVWQSTNNAQSWTQIGSYPTGELDQITTITGNPNVFGQVYVGFDGGGFAYLSAATTGPTISSLTESPSSGDLDAGKTVTLTLNLSEAVTVAGGTPTLTLNDGGTATYSSGSGTSALTFSYTVGAGQNTTALTATTVNLNSATITDGAGNAASLSVTGLTQTGPQIDTATPTISSLTESPSSGDLDAGKTVTLTLNLSEAVTVAGGTPTLTLNDGGTATYTSGSGTSALTFSYTVGAGQNTTALTATTVNLNSATITDGAGNAASLSLTGLTQTGPQIDTTTPTISSLTESPSSGDLDTSKTVTLTLNFSEAVTVAGGTPTLTLNDGSTATYTSGSGTSALTFSYTVAAGQNTTALTATAVNLNGGTIKDGAGNAASLSLTGLTQTGPQIDTTAPTVSSVTGAAGDYDAGKVLTLTLNMSEAVTVTGTPTLSLNDGGTATYVSGSGTSALTFSYTVLAGQNTAALQATTVAGTITDLAGNALGTSSLPQTLAGVIVNTTGPTISSLTESPSSGDLDAGKTVTLTLNLSEAVTVTGGTPTLTLNDGGTATYTSGSGTSALTFSYTVGAGQNTAALKATAVNLNSATITDGAGNAASLSLTGLTQTGPQVDTTAATISSLAESPSSGDLDAGKTVTLTLNLSEAVTVAGGTPTLTLNDGGTATYTSGSGTSALTFSYTVAAGQNTSALTATAVNLNSTTITDGAGNAASVSLTGLTQTGPQIDTTSPTISSLTESPSSGDLDAGKTVTLTLNFSEAVTVAGGTPTLTLNDGSTATYTSGSGTSALTFSYTVAAGQNTAALTATALNLNGGTIKDGAGNAASLSLTGLTQTGPQIDTIAPTVSSLTESPSSGDLDAGKTVTLTLNLSEAVTVAGGTPTLTLNDGGTATYTSGSGTSALTFSYTVAAGQNTTALTATAVNLNSATITDGAGNAASLSLTGLTQTGPQIDTATPTISSLTESPSSGDLDAGKTVTLTLNLSEAVTVAGGTPTLTLNDGGTATYTSGSGTSALTFSYTVAAGQNTTGLTATAVNLNSATVTDGAGNAASLSLTGLTQTGPQIDTATPTISSLTESPASGDLDAGKTVTLMLNFSEAVTVAGGTPTLTLNDGSTATYTSGSGTSALTFSYTVATGQNTTALTATALNLNGGTIKDGAGNAASLSLTGLTQTGPQIDTVAPTISSLTESPSSGDLDAGKTVTLTLNLSEAVTVAGGTPTLTLNDGSTATYTSGSGTSALTFSYTVATGQNTTALTATALNLNGGTIKDGAGNAASLSLTGLTQTGPQIDTVAPTISSLTESPSSGDLDAGKTVTLTLNLSEAVTVAGGTPTLTLNDGGTATYTSGSGTSALTFSYTVAAGQNTTALTATAVNLNSATITDGAGNAASLSLTGLTQTGPQIDTTAPTVSSVAATAGDYGAGQVLTLTLNMSGAVNVTGTPTLTLNDGGTASYVSGSGSNTLVFSYTVALGQNTAALKVTGVTGTITDPAGNALSTVGLPETFAGVTVVTTPTISAIAESPSSADLDAGNTVTFTLTTTEPVTVNTAGGNPTLTLNDGSIATYSGGSGTDALTFSYTVGAGQNTAALAATGVNLNGAVIQDGAGNPATLSLAGLTQTGPQIDTTTPTVSAILETPSSGDLGVGKTVTYTLTMSEAVTVNTAGGTPTFSLNDGGTATYVSGSGTNALTFSYTVLAGQSAADLMISAVNLNGATVQDGAGNAANLSLSGLNQGSPEIDTTTPTVSSLTESPSSGDLDAGNVVTLTLNMSEAVTIVGGAPTLALNDGGTATYSGGSGTTALTFSYTVAAGQNTAALAATAINLNGATIADGAGNAANFSLSGLNQSGPQIDTAAPTVVAATTAPAGGDVESGSSATITVTMSEIVNVTGTPTLALNDGGSATYLSGSGTSTLVFGYTAIASQNTAALQLTGAVTGGSITDAAGNVAVIAPTNLNLQVNTDQWENAISADWSSNSYWTSPAGAPTSFDTVMLDAPGSFQVSSFVNEDISDLNTVSTATLAITHSTFVINNGTAGGVQAGTISVGTGGTLNIDGVFDNTGTIWARGGVVNIGGSLTGGATEISGAGAVGIYQASNEDVFFSPASTGLLVIEGSGYSGWISGFGSNSRQSIDISGFKFQRSWSTDYVPNRADTAGTLYIANRTSEVAIQFTGTYTLADFHFASDGNSGTIVTDPRPAAVSNNAPRSIGNGAVSIVAAPDSGNVTFTGRSGTLDLAQPSDFTGTVSDFGAKNSIDLPTLAFDSQTEVSYSPKKNGTGGVLSVSNGIISTQIALLGQYTAANFGLMSDQHGGTMVVYEPPQSSNQPTLSSPHHG